MLTARMQVQLIAEGFDPTIGIMGYRLASQGLRHQNIDRMVVKNRFMRRSSYSPQLFIT